MVYQTTKPAPNDNLDVSVTDIQQNFLTANDVMNVDHYPFDDTTSSKGFHKDIHLVKRTGDPTPIPGTYIFYSKDYTPDSTGAATDTQFFGMTGLGGISQLTGDSAQSEGYTWVGGILLQWGGVSTNFATNTGSRTFKDRAAGSIPFPNNIWNIQCTFEGNSSSAQSIMIVTKSITGFTWKTTNTSSTSYTGFTWFAIGN